MNFTLPRFLREIHWPILVLTLVLTAIGLLEIYSATFRGGGGYASRQLTWSLIGIGIFFVTIWIGYRSILNLSYLLYGFTLVSLFWVLIFSEAHSGAHRWIQMGPIVIQPSEFAKLTTILMLAHFLAEESAVRKEKKTLLWALFFVGLPMFLVLKQPDLGSALVFMPVLIAMVFLWGARLRYFISFFLLALVSAPFAWHMLKPYQQKRLLVFLNPSIDPIGASYTAIQSKIAVGSGGLFGKGWLEGTQTQLDFVPEHHTDFIFSVIGEEFGFMGAFFLILLFLVLITYAFQVMEHTTDLRAKFLAAGIIVYFSFQVFVNIGMTVGLAPITGLPLPFISYGGSSLAANFFAFGLLASIHKERSIF